MRTVYVDTQFKCHLTNDGNRIPVETARFDGKCDSFVEGHRCIPADATYIRDDGEQFRGRAFFPWKPSSELEAAQREYERQKLAEYEALIDELYSEVTA